jgi:hypothetical protein
MLSSKHIQNLEVVELPEVDAHPEYDITEPYDDYKKLYDYMKLIIKNGKITTYKNTESTIQYRGTTIPLYEYENQEKIKKNDIYGGINKEVTTDNTVCRIMPVSSKGSTKWIGIYLKLAL